MKKIITTLVIIIMSVGTLSGCATTNTNPQDPKVVENVTDNNDQKQPSVETYIPKIVVDQADEEVEIPEKIERVVITFQPFGSIYPLFVGSAETIVGMLPGSMFAAQNSLLKTVFPEILDVDTGFYQNDEVNIESVLNMKPDIVLYMASNEKEREMYKKAGIPALGFNVAAADYNTVKTYNSWIEILGQAFGMEEKAQSIIAYNNKDYEEIQNRLGTLTEDEKLKILLLNNYNSTRMMTSGGEQFPDYWCVGSGGINVASGAFTGNKPISMEQVYEWDPDIIYITTFSPYDAQELIGNHAKSGDDWSSVKAVKNGQIHKFPLGMFRWYPPNSESILSLWWMSKTNYPALFEDIVIEDKVREYYDLFYNYSPTDEEMKSIFNPASEASGVSK